MTKELKYNDVVILPTGESGWVICKSEHDDTYLIELEVGEDVWVSRDLIKLYNPGQKIGDLKNQKDDV